MGLLDVLDDSEWNLRRRLSRDDQASDKGNANKSRVESTNTTKLVGRLWQEGGDVRRALRCSSIAHNSLMMSRILTVRLVTLLQCGNVPQIPACNYGLRVLMCTQRSVLTGTVKSRCHRSFAFLVGVVGITTSALRYVVLWCDLEENKQGL